MHRNNLISTGNENKKHFAAALNLARHNLFMLLKHISQSVKLNTSQDNEEEMINCALMGALKSKSTKNEQRQKIIDLLNRNMPFLKPMLDKEIDYAVYLAQKDFKEKNPGLFNYAPNDQKAKNKAERILQNAGNKAKMVTHNTYYNILVRIIRTLNAYRNEHTHYAPIDCWKENTLKDQKLIVRYMRHIFDGARRLVKERFEYTDSDMDFLTGNEHFEAIDVLDENGRPQYKNGRKEQKHVERKDFYYKLGNDDNSRLTATGLVMFCCLFINKQHAKILIDRIHLHRGRKYTTKKQEHIIFETFCNYRMKLNRERVESTRPDYALGLDMINELQKCPIVLFETLHRDNQDLFRVSAEYNDDELDKNLMVRYSDRFPRLAMAYIDQTLALDDLRFQVALGKYRYEFYEKKCIDSDNPDRLRALQKEINGFGRLNEIEQQRREKYKSFISADNLSTIDTIDSKPYITDQHAAYKITGNRIAMISANKHEGNMYLPDLNGKDTRCLQPDCWLSIYELPALIYHHLLTRNSDVKATALIIKTCIENYRRFFSDVKSGKLQPVANQEDFAIMMKEYGISTDDVPMELQDYLTGKHVDIEQKLEDRIYDSVNELIEITQKQLNHFRADLNLMGTKDNKIGKKKHANILPGSRAAWLAKDIVKWQPSAPEKTVNGKKHPQGWNKLTGLNFAVLQSALALFNGNLDDLTRILNASGITSGNYSHPFLNEVLEQKPIDTLHFYDIYLEKKISFLKNFKNSSDKVFDEISNVMTHYNRRRWNKRTAQWYKNLAGKYLAAPIELPRGLFESAIKEIAKSEYADIKELTEIINGRCNIAHLILRQHELLCGDSNQDFYFPEKGFKRTYKYFNLINNEKRCNRLQELYLTIDEMGNRIKSIKANNEEQRLINSIRYSNPKKQTEEREKTANALNHSKREYKDNEKTIRRYKVQDILMFMMAKVLLQSNIQNVTNYHLKDIRPDSEKNILSTQMPFSISITFENGKKITISQQDLKVKNFGDFFRFVYDERLKTLLPHIKELTEIKRSDLEREFDQYDRTRSEIFEEIHNIEKEIIETCGIAIDDADRINFRRLLIRKLGKDLDENSNSIIEIRNAFSHNRYPNDDIQQQITQVAKNYPNELKKRKNQ